jgi:hypothetical protein
MADVFPPNEPQARAVCGLLESGVRNSPMLLEHLREDGECERLVMLILVPSI